MLLKQQLEKFLTFLFSPMACMRSRHLAPGKISEKVVTEVFSCHMIELERGQSDARF